MPEITITATDGSGTFNAYVALPEADEPAPVIIAIQEIFGVNQDMRDKCDELAAQGYIAICPDLFWRIEPGIDLVDSKPAELERAFELFGLFDVDKGMEDLKATLKIARTLTPQMTRGGEGGTPERGNKVGCIGYCLGGKLAYMMAAQTDIDTAISYYGVGIQDMLNNTAAIQNPLLIHIAGEDEFTPKDAQDEISAAFEEMSHVITHRYDGTDHAFARRNGMHYNADAATLANTRTAAFLREALS
jgi:carboxymethylenebutenolidase